MVRRIVDLGEQRMMTTWRCESCGSHVYLACRCRDAGKLAEDSRARLLNGTSRGGVLHLEAAGEWLLSEIPAMAPMTASADIKLHRCLRFSRVPRVRQTVRMSYGEAHDMKSWPSDHGAVSRQTLKLFLGTLSGPVITHCLTRVKLTSHTILMC